ncbi:ABC-2 family transporter protein [compost metagenome]
MRNFLKAEAYYVTRDSMFKGISFILLFGSALLLIWMGSQVGFDIESPLEPLVTSIQLSFFLYFVIPIYVCFFATEGFEYGSVQTIIASGQSRSVYFMGKYVTGIKIIIWWVLLFFAVFYVLAILAALVTGSHIGNESLGGKFIAALGAIGFNILYLAAYSAVVLLFGVLMKKTASAIVATFIFVFGDFLLSGYLKDSSSALLRVVSDNTLTTQIFKFSSVNKQQLFGVNDYIHVTLIPVIIIVICLLVALVSFEKRDIHV